MFGIKTKFLSHLIRTRRLTDQKNIRDLMDFFQADEYGHEANISQGDLGYGWIHYGFIRHLKPAKILCVGSRYGFIPAVLAQACKDNGSGHVDFVDAGYGGSDKAHWTGEGYWKTTQGKLAFHRFGLDRHFIEVYVMTTQQFAKKYSELSYDYIYIDGDHSYKGAKKDYKLLLPLLKKNGFIVFHDVTVKETKKEGKYGVWKLWKELARKNAITLPGLGSGLGIYQKR